VQGDVGVDAGGVVEEGWQEGGELVDVACRVGVEDVFGGAQAAPGAGPLLGGGVFGAAEEVEVVVIEGGAGLADYGECVGLGEAGEVEEVGLLTEGVEDGAGAVLDFGGGEHGDCAGREAEGQLGAAVGIFLGGDAGGYWEGSAGVQELS
jgi:hypothetical protein